MYIDVYRCIYVCIYVCMYVCMYVYIYIIYMRVCATVCEKNVYMYTDLHICTYMLYINEGVIVNTFWECMGAALQLAANVTQTKPNF